MTDATDQLAAIGMSTDELHTIIDALFAPTQSAIGNTKVAVTQMLKTLIFAAYADGKTAGYQQAVDALAVKKTPCRCTTPTEAGPGERLKMNTTATGPVMLRDMQK